MNCLDEVKARQKISYFGDFFWHAERLTPNSIDARTPPVARIVKGRQTHSFWVKQNLATNGPEMHELKNIIYIVNVILGDFFLMFFNYVVWCMFSYSVKGRKWHNKNSDKSSKPATTGFGASCVHLRFPPLDIYFCNVNFSSILNLH